MASILVMRNRDWDKMGGGGAEGVCNHKRVYFCRLQSISFQKYTYSDLLILGTYTGLELRLECTITWAAIQGG